MALKLTSDFWGRQVTPLEHAGGAGIAAGGPLQQYGNPYVLPQDGYQRLAEGSNVSMSSTTSGDSMAMSMVDSSVGSTGSQTAMLMHPDLRPRGGRDNSGSLVGYSVVRNQNNGNRGGGGGRGGGEEEDALAVALMDVRYPAQGLAGYEDWIINLQFLTLGPAFAQGAFGKLYRGTYNGQEVAVKILERPENDTDRALIMEQQFVQEVMMLANLRHQNVVRFIGSCTKPSVWCVVTEYAKGGSVRSFLARRQNRTIPLKAAVKQALDVARGMEYLHSLGFIHRDLKSDNLLIATDKSIKIADFGAARIEVQTEGMTPETGTYRWMAPEMIQHRSYSNKVDVYSFGIVLWELITGKLPFQNMTAVQAAFAVVNKGVRPIIPHECPPSLTQIMTRCWDANPDERPPFSQVVKLLEEAEIQIVTTVGRARFRCCLTAPLTHE